MRLYLDTCCWNRPFDDLAIGQNRNQAVAVVQIIKWARRHGVTIFGSDALETEIGKIKIKNAVKYAQVSDFYRRTVTDMAPFVEDVFNYVESLAERAGMEGLDIHHVAFAVCAGVDYLITTDIDFIDIAPKLNVPMRVVNPLDFNIGDAS
jgi:predicted nucleic acid-binding protein